MALNFGQSLGVSGNIKLTDVELVRGGYRTLQNSSDTGSIPIGRLEDGQVFYIENEDKLLKVSESLADNENTFVNSYTFLDFSWPASAGAASSIPASDNTFNLGSESKSWKDLHIDGQINMGTGIDFNRIGSAKLSVTGSSFDFKATDSSDLFTIRNSSDQVSIQFDDKVLVMGSVTGAPPTPVAGGLYYSGSDEWFLGYEN
tara:strand:+ start:452 stop:1057 length:606 start_codon:yes stop_codon:yes gene_type:complete